MNPFTYMRPQDIDTAIGAFFPMALDSAEATRFIAGGTNLLDLMKQKRLEEAYHLIQNKKINPSMVYLEVGFENLSHF